MISSYDAQSQIYETSSENQSIEEPRDSSSSSESSSKPQLEQTEERTIMDTSNGGSSISKKDIVSNIYSLRKEFLIIALTGRTGSGCTTVANILAEKDFSKLKSTHQTFRYGPIDNQARKDRIVYNFISKNWKPFTVITASSIIYYYAFQLTFDEFLERLYIDKDDNAKGDNKKADLAELKRDFGEIEERYNKFSDKLKKFVSYIDNRDYRKLEISKEVHLRWKDFILTDLDGFRRIVEQQIDEHYKGKLPNILQNWGNNIRQYKSVRPGIPKSDAPQAIAEAISEIIKFLRHVARYSNKQTEDADTRIVIDALRNPFEILYFRERFSAFYCMSINTPKNVRHDKLGRYKNLRPSEIINIDNKEEDKRDFELSFQYIDIDKCIELSDIHLSHDGTDPSRNYRLVNQLFTYVSLMLHPGLVQPTPQERLMQIAFTAKLNSGCLSRQVGAAVTDSNYSLKAIGWNSTPEGQVPCTLRQLDDLFNQEDQGAFSAHELHNKDFKSHVEKLKIAYSSERRINLNGIGLTYCFKNIHTAITDKQLYNQVHTRSLHAEENAFLQIAKYGGVGINGGKLFTTASCCELCAKKAFHLGIKEIYYIDSYPGISMNHVFLNGDETKRPKVILFTGAVGRAYISLYNPFLPLKDEIEALTDVKVSTAKIIDNNSDKQAENLDITNKK